MSETQRRHAGVHELLSVRDGDPVDAHVVKHIEACAACLAQLRGLSDIQDRLRALPPTDAPCAWPEMQEQLRSRERRTLRMRSIGALSAAAAVAALSLGVFMQRPSAPEQTVDVLPTTPAASRLEPLIVRSQELERVLAGFPQRSSVERVSSAATLDRIEGRIQQLDEQLSYASADALDAQQSQQLWRERVALMESLVKVRYAETQRLYF